MCECLLITFIHTKGTSGSGKSTFGSALASALDVPFIDGDDLHPKANVEKMSRGEPLNDDDRLPWLLSIRRKALDVCSGKGEHQPCHGDESGQEQQRIRQLAEVQETSQQDEDREDRKNGIIEKAADWKSKEETSEEPAGQQDASPAHQEACVIACSALKKSYRHLLRFGLDVADKKHEETDEDEFLNVHHVYLHVSPEELLRRMHERKGHFMKEGMLKSQLQTLEDPSGEPKTVVLEQGPTAELIEKSRAYFEPVFTGV